MDEERNPYINVDPNCASVAGLVTLQAEPELPLLGKPDPIRVESALEQWNSLAIRLDSSRKRGFPTRWH